MDYSYTKLTNSFYNPFKNLFWDIFFFLYVLLYAEAYSGTTRKLNINVRVPVYTFRDFYEGSFYALGGLPIIGWILGSIRIYFLLKELEQKQKEVFNY